MESGDAISQETLFLKRRKFTKNYSRKTQRIITRKRKRITRIVRNVRTARTARTVSSITLRHATKHQVIVICFFFLL